MADIELTTVPSVTAIADGDIFFLTDVSDTPDEINAAVFSDIRTSIFASGATIDFGAGGSFELPNGAAPTVNADGEIAVDTTVTDFSHGFIKYYSGEEMAVIAVPVAELGSPTNGHVIAYNSTNDEFELTAVAGGIGGSTGGTDNRALRASGTGGATVDSSAVTIDDSGNVTSAGYFGFDVNNYILGTSGYVELRGTGAPYYLTDVAFYPGTTNLRDLGHGATPLAWKNLFLEGYIEVKEMSAPSSPAANKAVIYAEDNGAGKTRIMAKFSDGSTAQIAIQP